MSRPGLRVSRRRGVTLFLILCALPLLGVFPYLAAVNNPNENVRIYMTMSLVERGEFRIDEMVKTFGWVNDMAVVHTPAEPPHHYSVKAPATSYAGIPAYWFYARVIAPLFHTSFPGPTSTPVERQSWLRNSIWACRLFAVQIPCFLFLIAFERYLRAFTTDRAIRLSAVAAACLGTNYLAYDNMFVSHATFAVAAFGSFAFTERERRIGDPRKRRLSRAALAGFCASWCVALEYHSLFVAVVLTLWGLVTFYRPTRLLAFSAGGLVNVGAVMLFQWRSFGSPLTPGHKMAETAQFAAAHNQGLFGIMMPKLDVVSSLLFDPTFGFVGTSPFMALALVGAPLILFGPLRGMGRARRHLRLAVFVCVLAMVAIFGVNAGYNQWRGGWTVGPRFLGCAPPFFAFVAVVALERLAAGGRLRRAVVRGLAGGAALASVVAIGTVGIMYNTLPEAVPRPMAQFFYPLFRAGFVPHHVAEWIGVAGTWPWYVICAALVLAPIAAGIGYGIGELGRVGAALRVAAFLAAFAAAMLPAISKPENGGEMFVLYPDGRFFPIWEPAGRDRITKLREEAERYGARRPCNWYRIADLERVIGMDPRADEARALGVPREGCAKLRF